VGRIWVPPIIASRHAKPLHEIWKIAEDKETPSRLRVQAYKTLAQYGYPKGKYIAPDSKGG